MEGFDPAGNPKCFIIRELLPLTATSKVNKVALKQEI
jgi:hypothetical protein